MAVTVVRVCFCGGGVVCILGVGAVGLQLLYRFPFLVCAQVSVVAESLVFTLNTDSLVLVARGMFLHMLAKYLSHRK